MHAMLAQGDGSFWMPGEWSTFAGEVDWLFYFVLYVSVFFTLLVAGLLVFFAIRYHDHGERGGQAKGPTHNTTLEMTWTIIPLLIVLVIFLVGFRGFVKMANPPEDFYDIQVSSAQWRWGFTYPGKTSGDLVVPAGENIRVVLTSQDVIHSFYVPAFRVKRDAVPGRYNKTWFHATWNENATETVTLDGDEYQAIIHDLYCAEYCGQSHSRMLAKVYVLTPEDFRKWVAKTGPGPGPLHEIGKQIVEGKGGCLQCHTVTEEAGPLAPGLGNLFGATETLVSGERVEVDERYIRDSLFDPQAEIVAGYDPTMPTFENQLADWEVDAIIAYLQSISDEYHGDILGSEPPGEGEGEDGAATPPDSDGEQPQPAGS